MEWKTLSSEYLVKTQYFTARKDKCEKPDGKIVPEFYVVERGLTMCALALTEDNRVIMVRQYRHALKQVTFEIPGGFAEKDEEPEMAIARELKEETGYEFSKCEWVGEVAADGGFLDSTTKLYLATGGKKVADQSLDPNEEIKVELISIDELIKLLMESKIVQSLHANAIFYSLIKLGRLKLV